MRVFIRKNLRLLVPERTNWPYECADQLNACFLKGRLHGGKDLEKKGGDDDWTAERLKPKSVKVFVEGNL